MFCAISQDSGERSALILHLCDSADAHSAFFFSFLVCFPRGDGCDDDLFIGSERRLPPPFPLLPSFDLTYLRFAISTFAFQHSIDIDKT